MDLVMKRGARVALVVIVIILLLTACPVLGESESGTATVLAGDHLVFEVDHTANESFWMSYEVQVLEGPPINVWFVDEEGYRDFSDENASTFSYQSNLSHQEVFSAEESFYLWSKGTHYLIFDNDRNLAEGEAVKVTYSITWGASDFDFLLVGGLALATVMVIIVVVVVLLVLVKRQQSEANIKQAMAAKEVMEARRGDRSGKPRPPKPYPDWVVEASLKGEFEDDDATGWDPSRDEPGD